LHACNSRTGWDAGRVLERLTDDLKGLQRDNGLRPDLVFFTGDAAFGHVKNKKGQKIADQFKEAETFFEGVRNAFDPVVRKEDFFIVPGNHDVNRTGVDKDETPWIAKASLKDIIEEIHRKTSQWKRYIKRLDEYKRFLANNNYVHCLSDPSRLIFGAVKEIYGVKIGIAGLNSSWSCCQDNELGQLRMAGKFQIETLNAHFDGVDFKIALMHHPVNWFREDENPSLLVPLERDFRFCLHGHEHQQWVTALADGHTRIAAGACYESSDKPTGYNFVRLHVDLAIGEVWLREFDPKGGVWIPNIVGGKTDREGIWPLTNLQWLQRIPSATITKNPVSTSTTTLALAGPTAEQDTHTSKEDWFDITDALDRIKQEIAAISVFFHFPNHTANTVVGIRAALDGLTADEAKHLCSIPNLDRFLLLLNRFRRGFINRIGRIQNPTTDDVDRIFAGVKWQLDDDLAKAVQGDAFHRFEELFQDFMSRIMATLHSDLANGAEQVTPKQVEAAFAIVVRRDE